MALNDKQLKFCNEYLVDLSATQAAIRAGYSERTAGSIGFDLLKKPEIAEKIREEMEKRAFRTEVTQDRVLLEIARLAFNDPRKAFTDDGNLLPVKQWPDEVAAAISSIKITETTQNDDPVTYLKEIKFWDKGRQIELAARHLGMLHDKLNMDVDATLNIIINKPEAD